MAKMLKFNPGFQSDDEAVANFIVRRQELDTVTEAFTQAGAESTTPPRVLVVAPRGAGKTTLCRRVLAETRRSDALGQKWRAIFLGEESYTVTTPGEFFLECLFQLRDQAPEAELEAAYAAASSAVNEDELIGATLGALRMFADAIGKRLLIIVENFHIILHDQIGTGAGELLKRLGDDTLFGVLATSVAQASTEDDAKLPADYLRLTLRPLSLEECHALWEALTGQPVKLDRIRPLQILTGGSPRLLHILAEFMRTPSLQDLMGNLNLLIDQNTEYFKSQLDALPAIERKVFAALLDAWDPSTAKQISQAARVNTNIASAMLARLSERGAVIKEPGRGRAAIYYAAERLFNIYYLMRRRSHPSSRVRALVSFMTEYYDRDELVDTTALLVREACGVEPERRGDYHSTFDAIMSRASETVRRRILEQTPQEFIRSFREDHKAQRDQDVYLTQQESTAAAQDDEADIGKLIEGVEAAADEGDFDRARELLQLMIDRWPTMAEPWVRLALVHQRRGDTTAAIFAAQQARNLKPDDPWTLAVLGTALARADRRDEAEDAFVEALKLDPAQIMALIELAEIREGNDEVEAAIELYQHARASGRFPDLLRSRYGLLLLQEDLDDQAEAVLREGVFEDFDNVESRRVLVDFLDATDRQDEGIAILKSAAEQLDRWEAWADLGTFLHARTDRQAEAKHALELAIEKGGEWLSLYRQLAHAMMDADAPREEVASVAKTVIDRFPDSAGAWTIAGEIYRGLNQDERAERAYRTALERDGGDYARVHLARLLQQKPGRRLEAEALLREAVTTAEGREACGPSKELAELLIHNGDDLAADAIVQQALEKNDECFCCLVLQGQICTRRGDLDQAKERFNAALSLHEDGIPALTGLARVVDGQEAEALIARAIAASPDDPRCLLARAQLRNSTLETRIEDAQEALALDSCFLEAHLLLAPLEAGRGNFDEALDHLQSALSDLPTQRELIPSFVSAAMTLARYGQGERLSRMLEEHESGLAVEPLAIALRLSRGEQPMVAKEVLEVAKDIVERFGHATDEASLASSH